MTHFYVINWDFNGNKLEKYDIMPYLMDCYKKSKKKPKTFEEFRDFVIKESKYQWWSRCEYEILIGDWPFGSYNFTQDIKEFLKSNPDLELHDTYFTIKNIVMKEMKKIDVCEQIMMNLDVITQLLMNNIN